ncbi:hypothetical protein [Lactobacillus sp. HT06-2]|uniref:hypothetical protein n=1 Tax=Lactobacillus sp. HT06-2 TaxID=2080222 RepID=UPI000CD8ADCE|nr:hypothetical protein [Lactobacillus sp. HT06-2]
MMDTLNTYHFPKGTPKNVILGKSHFVKSDLLIKAITDAGYSANEVSKRCFHDRGPGKAKNKVNDWLKHRYPAKTEDWVLVLRLVDPDHIYARKDFYLTPYNDEEFRKALTAYSGYGAQKIEGKKRSEFRRKAKAKKIEAAEQGSLF